MKRLILLLLLLVAVTTTFAQGFGESVKINHNWRFNLGNVKYGGAEFFDDSQWGTLDLPHDWSVEQGASSSNSSCTGFLPGGIGWYRKDLDVAAEKKGQKVYVYFEGVYNNSDVYINGKWIGRRPNGYISFCYDLTKYINFGGRNVIAVSVDHTNDADSRWYTGSGIYRDVYMVYANPVHINLWGASYSAKVDERGATIDLKTEISNNLTNEANVKVDYTLYDAEGRIVAASSKSAKAGADQVSVVEAKMSVTRPILWGLDNPYLYTLKTKVSDKGKIVDSAETKVGIRKLTFDPNAGFALNDVKMKLKGVCLHHDAGCLGAAVPKEVWLRRIAQLKGIGCNAIRTSHNPQATGLYEVCDELGMLVMNEAFDEWEYPKKKWITGWNKGTPGFQGSALYFREWGRRDLADMIRRDRNHPSVIMWSIGNEVDYPNDPYSHPVLNSGGIGQVHVAGYQKTQPHANRLGEIAQELAAEARKHDTSRPVTAALAGVIMSNETAYPTALDIVGYNYTESRYPMDHKKYPSRVLYGSENRHDYKAWKAVRDNDFILGQFIWTGYDFLGEAGPWPSRGSSAGLIDLSGNIKPRGYFRQSLWSEKPVLYVGTAGINAKDITRSAKQLWNYEEGERINVVAYTNCQQAELFLDGKSYGECKQFDDSLGVISWEVPFKAGKLSVVGYDEGAKVTENQIVTTGRPHKIVAKLYETKVSGKDKLVHIDVEIHDQNGNLVTLADNEVVCDVSGAGQLRGLDSSSNDAADNYRNNRQRCLDGKLLAYVVTTQEKGNVTVKFSSSLIESATVEFAIE